MPDLCSEFECRWLRWVVLGDSDLYVKNAALIARARWTANLCFPMEEIPIDTAGSQEFVRQLPGFTGGSLEAIMLYLESLTSPNFLKRVFFDDLLSVELAISSDLHFPYC